MSDPSDCKWEPEKERKYLEQLYERAMDYAESDPEVFPVMARKTAEAICLAIIRQKAPERKLPKLVTLQGLIEVLATDRLVPERKLDILRGVQTLCNPGAHASRDRQVASEHEIQPSVQTFKTFADWALQECLGMPGNRPARPRGKAVREIFFVQPTARRNDFYFDFQSRLVTLVSALKDRKLVVVQPRGNEPGDMYSAAEPFAAEAGPEDAVILVPRGAGDPAIEHQLSAIVNRCRARIVFFDQPPPASLRAPGRRFFVGVEPDAVGYLAAAGLRRRLKTPEAASWLVFAGPGGRPRWQSFQAAIRRCHPNAEIRVEHIPDLDRVDNGEHLRAVVADLDPQLLWGIFAGNDETAVGVLAGLRASRFQKFALAGCDATKEMRARIDEHPKMALCTIDTQIDRQCASVTQVLQFGGEEDMLLQEPTLYPGDRIAQAELRQSLAARSGTP